MKVKPLLEVAEDIMKDIKEAKNMTDEESFPALDVMKIFEESMPDNGVDDALILSKRDWDKVSAVYKSEKDKEFKLCLVLDNQAWFTTQDVTKQWGDDWDDAPYEHNAGPPYEYDEHMDCKPYEIKKVYWESEWKYYAPPIVLIDSVKNTNDGVNPWLIWHVTPERDNIIDAGTTLEEFKKLVDVYEKST